MATTASIIARVRRELGDFEQHFRASLRADGEQTVFDLPATNVVGVSVTKIHGGDVVLLITGTDFTLDGQEGTIAFDEAPEDATVFMVEGTCTGLFTDEEIGHYVHDAFTQHTHGVLVSTRYRDEHGFIEYVDEAMTLETLPEVEELLVALLATIEALWALSTDASTDIDIQTAEGTSVPRSQRYAQLRHQIDVLTEKYTDLCKQLNVGLHRIEVGTLRRVSRTTGRLIPVFTEREYDDHRLPTRQLPKIDKRDQDESGIPSPLFGSWGY